MMEGLGSIVKLLKGHVYLIVAIVIGVAIAGGYFFRTNSSEIDTQSTDLIVVFSLLGFVIVAMFFDYLRTKPKPSLKVPPVTPHFPEVTTVTSYYQGLELLMKAINGVEDKNEIVLWRILPTEFTKALAEPENHTTIKAITSYLDFSSLVIKGGGDAIDFWDETIVGHIPPTQDKIHEMNQATWRIIKDAYFMEPQPDTTFLGIDKDISKWLIIVGLSSKKMRYMTDYICALEMEHKENTLRKPLMGKFYTEEYEVMLKAREFEKVRTKVENEGNYWDIISLSEKEWIAAGSKTKKFILTGKLSNQSETKQS